LNSVELDQKPQIGAGEHQKAHISTFLNSPPSMVAGELLEIE
jgi:hypothetical protein